MCTQDDCLCHALHPTYAIADGGIDCDYYLAAVLPSDKELFDCVQTEIYRGTINSPSLPTKKCVRCAKPFIPRSNRQRYCVMCAVEAEKKNHKKRQRKLYWKAKT